MRNSFPGVQNLGEFGCGRTFNASISLGLAIPFSRHCPFDLRVAEGGRRTGGEPVQVEIRWIITSRVNDARIMRDEGSTTSLGCHLKVHAEKFNQTTNFETTTPFAPPPSIPSTSSPTITPHPPFFYFLPFPRPLQCQRCPPSPGEPTLRDFHHNQGVSCRRGC